MEVLLVNPETRSQQIDLIMANASQNDPYSSAVDEEQIRSEIKAILRSLRGDVEESIDVRPDTTMDPKDWKENHVSGAEYSPQIETFHVQLPRGSLRKLRFTMAGLSPACSHAFFLNDEMAVISSLGPSSGERGKEHILPKPPSRVKYYSAALSDKFFVVLQRDSKRKTLQVYRHDGSMVGTECLSVETSGSQWNASDLIAIHGAKHRTWIAIGGCIKQDDVLTGSIKMFCVDENMGVSKLRTHSVSFNRPKPNPLALDLVKTLNFSQDGRRLICATNNNKILVWHLSNNARPLEAPFVIQRELKAVSLRSCLLEDSRLINFPSLGYHRWQNRLYVSLRNISFSSLSTLYHHTFIRKG